MTEPVTYAKPADWWPQASHAHESRTEIEDCPDPKAYFMALLDVVNPLQHLPVIGNIYRHVTGDEIAPVSRVVGGGLYLGLGGVISGLINAAFETITGKDVGGTALAFLFGEPKHGATQIAAAEPASALPAAPAAIAAAPASAPALAQAEPEPMLTEVPVSEMTQSGIREQIAAAAEALTAPPASAPAPTAAVVPTPAPVAENRRFFPINRAQASFVAEPAAQPRPVGLIRANQAEAAASGAMSSQLQAAQAAGAYGRGLDLSKMLQEHYQTQTGSLARMPAPGR